MKYKRLPPETLLINNWYSTCNNCGKPTLPNAETHHTISGEKGGNPGCGIRWKYIYPEYIGPGIEDIVKNMRPDLKFLSLKDKLERKSNG